MASHALIMQIEQHIINTITTIDATIGAVKTEVIVNTPPGTVYPENRDLWGTLAINVWKLHRKTRELGLALNNAGNFNHDYGT